MGLVVMVEDDEDVRRLHTHILRKAGHTVIEREDAQGLVELPRENGVSDCRRLKSNPMTAGTQVVMITAYDSFEATRQTTEAGADRHLIKPISEQSLLRCAGATTKSSRPKLFRRLRRAFGT